MNALEPAFHVSSGANACLDTLGAGACNEISLSGAAAAVLSLCRRSGPAGINQRSDHILLMRGSIYTSKSGSTTAPAC